MCRSTIHGQTRRQTCASSASSATSRCCPSSRNCSGQRQQVGDPHPNQLTSEPHTRPLTRTPRTRKADPTAPDIIDETLGSHGGVTDHSSPLPPRRFVARIPDPGAPGDGGTARGEALRGRDGRTLGVGVQADADVDGDDDGDGGARFGTRYGGRVGSCARFTWAEGDAHADRSIKRPCATRLGLPRVLETQAVQRAPQLCAPGPVRTGAQRAQCVLPAPDPHAEANQGLSAAPPVGDLWRLEGWSE
jgi:hypothetical protein